jgi:hypothetical protein
MNKTFFRFFSIAILMCLLLCSCGNENKKEIKRFLKNYNGMVSEMEKLKKKNNMDEFEKYVNMFISSSQRGNRLSRLSEWTVKDGDKFSELFGKGNILIFLNSFVLVKGDYNQGNRMISSFWMSTHEVTQFEYSVVMDNNPSLNEGYQLPVENVSFYDAVKFCNKLSESRGYTPCYSMSGNEIECDFTASGYRLPTREEWLYAAEGGRKSNGYKYSGSDELSDVAWYYSNSDDETQLIRQKKPNELGIYDMNGNVKEWCWDLEERYWMGVNFSLRCILGGAYNSGSSDCDYSDTEYTSLFTTRYWLSEDTKSDNIGFRIVRHAAEHSAWDD